MTIAIETEDFQPHTPGAALDLAVPAVVISTEAELMCIDQM
jgi:hypothetical protein